MVQQMTIKSCGAKKAGKKITTKEAVHGAMKLFCKIDAATGISGTMLEDLANTREKWEYKDDGYNPYNG